MDSVATLPVPRRSIHFTTFAKKCRSRQAADATFHADRIVGRSSGQGRLVQLSRRSRLDRLPVLSLHGQDYAPGTNDNTLIVPMLPGEHDWEVRPLPQPAIFRSWQPW
jgi:hypothetical protein